MRKELLLAELVGIRPGSDNIGSGWSALADECGIARLFPEQRKTNNPIGSFNWFKLGDSRRGGGEPLSIRHMTSQVIDDHAIDPSRVFITELPYRNATTSMQAMFRMKGYGQAALPQTQNACARGVEIHRSMANDLGLARGSGQARRQFQRQL